MLPTVRSTLPYHPAMEACRQCSHSQKLGLVALDAAGYGETALIELPCRAGAGAGM